MTAIRGERTGTRYDPWLDAARRYGDIHIEWHPIAPARAAWCPGARVILVDENISRTERRCALAHELAHLDTGDRPTDQCWFATRQETNADLLAAQRLVELDALLDVLRWCQDPREVAAELEVTLEVLVLRAQRMHPAHCALVHRALLALNTAA